MIHNISIACNGGFFDLLPGSSIEWEWQSQLFEMDMAGNSEFSLPMDLPMTKNNLLLLKFENLLGLSTLNAVPYDAEIFVENTKLIDAKLYVSSVDGNFNTNSGKFSIVMVGYKSDFIKKTADLQLKQLVLGGTLASDAVANKVYPTILVRDDNCGEGNYELPEWMVNVYINGALQSVGIGYNDKKFVRVPFFKMIFILKKIFESINIDLTSTISNVLMDTDFNKIIIEANKCENYSDENNTTAPYYGITWGTLASSVSSHMPDNSVNEFIAALKINFGMHFNYKTDGSVDIILMKDIATKTAIDWTDKVNVEYSKKIPQSRIGTFVFEFTQDGTDGYVSKPTDTNGNVVNSLYNSTTIIYPLAEVEDLSQISLPSSASFFYVKNENCFYKNNGSSVSYYGNALQKLIIGNDRDNWISDNDLPSNAMGSDGDYYLQTDNDNIWVKLDGSWHLVSNIYKNNIFNAKSPASIPAMIEHTVSNVYGASTSYTIHVPIQDREYRRFEMVGSSHPYSNDLSEIKGEPNMKLRFLLWHGIQNPYNYSSPDLSYGYASTSNYLINNIGTKLSNFNLSWYGSEGLFNTFWKPFEKTLTDYTEVEFKVRLTILDYLNLDVTTPVMIRNSEYYIKSIKQSFPLTSEATVTLILKK